MLNNRQRALLVFHCMLVGSLAILALYVYIYWRAPFPDPWNDFVINLFDALASGLCSCAAIAVWRRYRKSEKLFSVWRYFTIGLLSWIGADVLWAVYNLTVNIVPVPSFADLFYVAGYCFLFIAIHRQYRVIFQPSWRRDVTITSILAVTEFALTILLSWTFSFAQRNPMTLGSTINTFYAVADLGIVVVAAIFTARFGGGVFARPWLGLVVFCAADGLYAWFTQSGIYAFSIQDANLDSLITDTLYIAAYLLLAALLINHYLLLKLGPSMTRKFNLIRKQEGLSGSPSHPA